jgi:pheromone a factor receptor
VLTPPTFFLFYAWPVAIGCVSLVYCGEFPRLSCASWSRSSFVTVLTIHTLYKREHQFRQVISSNRNLNRSRYFRLMALSSLEILGTLPMGIYWIVYNAKNGVEPWVSWADTHIFYSRIPQFASFLWKNDHAIVVGLEGYRWSLIACAFLFFAFFGFADEARLHYRLVYTTLASRIGISTTSLTLHGSSHAYVIVVNTLS